MSSAVRPEHGGNSQALCRRLGVCPDTLLDLSTGLNPNAYELPPMPGACLRTLPNPSGELRAAAASYYGVAPPFVLAVPGSQAAIQLLPLLRSASRVLAPRFGYEEHRYRWQMAGHDVIFYDSVSEIGTQLDSGTIDVLVVIHPNNPTAEYVDKARLLAWRNQLREGGWLIVDEAFIDAQPEQSVVSLVGQPGVIMLRSVGKFFGLPGLRLGFVLAAPDTLQILAEAMGPWPVAAPAQWAGPILFADTRWQAGMRRALCLQGEALLEEVRSLFSDAELIRGTPFFCSVRLSEDAAFAAQLDLAKRGVLTRVYHQGGAAWLRIGLPPEGSLRNLLAAPYSARGSAVNRV